MKAVVYTEYGPPDVLQIKEVEKPTPNDDEILIKVEAASVNLSDWEMLRGIGYARMGGLRKPRRHILGSDIAGRVEAVGKNITRFAPGDEVFGDILGGMGGFAEYALAGERALALKPAGITFEEASAIPQAAVIALQGIRDKAQVKPGHERQWGAVLINGAGGGAGSLAVQLAKMHGAEVTGVDNTGKLDFMRSLGADHVIDYTREDFTRSGKKYDFILDLVAHRSVFDYRRALRSGGSYYAVGGSLGSVIQILLLGPLIGRIAGKKIGVLIVRSNPEDMLHAAELCQAGKIVLHIDRRFSLNEVPDALRYLGEGRVKGKIVITMGEGTGI